jgi:integrase
MPKKTFQLWTRRASTKTLYANFTVKGLPRFRQSLETDDKEEAQLRAAALKLEAERRARGLIDEKKLEHEITLGQALGKYMLYIREEDKPVARLYEGYCDELLDYFGNGTLFHTLDTAQVSEFTRHLRQRRFARGGEKKGLANSSLNRRLVMLRAMANRARDVWRVRAPKIEFKKLKSKEAPPPTRIIRGPEEMARIRDGLDDARDLFDFLSLSGVRVGDAIEVRWQQVDWANGKIDFIQKGDRPHVVWMTPPIRAILERQKGLHAVYVFTYLCRLGCRKIDRRSGKRHNRTTGQRYPFTYGVLRKRWDKVRTADLNLHRIRATAITRVIRAKGTKRAQFFAGHAQPSTTWRYESVVPEDVRDAMPCWS